VQVFLDDLLMLEGEVTVAGRVRRGSDRLQNQVHDAPSGKMCRVVCDGRQLCATEIVRD
jgi:hypothetical protein